MASLSVEGPGSAVAARGKRRRFAAEYKLSLLRAAEASTKSRGLAALLRAERLHASQLSRWRKQAESGELSALTPKKRGPLARATSDLGRRASDKDREIAMWKRRAEQAEALVALQRTSLSAARRGQTAPWTALRAARELAPKLSVSAACAALGIARATYYRDLARQSETGGDAAAPSSEGRARSRASRRIDPQNGRQT